VILFPCDFLIVTHVVFSVVGVEMLSGGSVVAEWDQKERAGPKDDRQGLVQVTGTVVRYSTDQISKKM
jgi:hypothetical protein